MQTVFHTKPFSLYKKSLTVLFVQPVLDDNRGQQSVSSFLKLLSFMCVEEGLLLVASLYVALYFLMLKQMLVLIYNIILFKKQNKKWRSFWFGLNSEEQNPFVWSNVEKNNFTDVKEGVFNQISKDDKIVTESIWDSFSTFPSMCV